MIDKSHNETIGHSYSIVLINESDYPRLVNGERLEDLMLDSQVVIEGSKVELPKGSMIRSGKNETYKVVSTVTHLDFELNRDILVVLVIKPLDGYDKVSPYELLKGESSNNYLPETCELCGLIHNKYDVHICDTERGEEYRNSFRNPLSPMFKACSVCGHFYDPSKHHVCFPRKEEPLIIPTHETKVTCPDCKGTESHLYDCVYNTEKPNVILSHKTTNHFHQCPFCHAVDHHTHDCPRYEDWVAEQKKVVPTHINYPLNEVNPILVSKPCKYCGGLNDEHFDGCPKEIR